MNDTIFPLFYYFQVALLALLLTPVFLLFLACAPLMEILQKGYGLPEYCAKGIMEGSAIG